MEPDESSRAQSGNEEGRRPDSAVTPSGRPRISFLIKLGINPDAAHLSLSALCVALATGLAWSLVTDYAGTKVEGIGQRQEAPKNEQAQRDAESAVDLKEPPFTVNVRYLAYGEVDTDTESVVFDNKLPISSFEDSRLRDVIRAQRGRPLVPATVGWGVPVKITLGTGRKGYVSITGMTVDVHGCRKSQANAVISMSGEGVSSVESANFDLREDGSSPRGTISTKDIVLGNGEPPTSLLVVGEVPTGKTCEWTIRATYVDANNKEDTAVIDNNGQPFRSEGLPREPDQWFAADWKEKRWVDCNSEEGLKIRERGDTQCHLSDKNG
ncbi:hypothetical protein [Streptomyces sp. NPDC047453]|uniref:hypothetical protein n=1 Tax=Streptomyces sp. NPDC047453 TaxID=3154812 RepID=UPI0033F2FBF4